MPDEPRRRGTRTLFVAVPVAILLVPLAYSVVSSLFTREAEAFYERPDAKYEECVRDTEYMRFHHWELLRGIREEVVRYGTRGELGLQDCSKCHSSRERFCDRCHQAVSLSPDCFGCHYYP
jgi:hypothetical protein